MTENESVLITLQNAVDCATDDVTREDLEMMVKCLEELQQYRAMEQRLQKVYGECEGLLETVVQHLENHENIELPDNIIKAKLLTDEDVDKWEQFKAIGTIDEFKALKENFENAKDDIRKLLSSEYGSSCQFCVHDENEDAMCCNIGGSGSWCCENARWKEH